MFFEFLLGTRCVVKPERQRGRLNTIYSKLKRKKINIKCIRLQSFVALSESFFARFHGHPSQTSYPHSLIAGGRFTHLKSAGTVTGRLPVLFI